MFNENIYTGNKKYLKDFINLIIITAGFNMISTGKLPVLAY